MKKELPVPNELSSRPQRSLKGRLLSLVVPLYNEEACIEPLTREIDRHLQSINLRYEIVFIDDGSEDMTPFIIEALTHGRSDVRGVRLSRNAGHQGALACGLSHARGDIVIMMDGDLQHPPALVLKMLELWQQGYDVVNTVRLHGERSGWIDKVLSSTFYRVFNRIAEIKLIPGGADFRLLDRRCVDALNSMPEYLKFYRGQVPYIGFRQTALSFECSRRFGGKRSYSIRKSLRLASNGLFSFSTFGLKLPFFLGIGILVLVILYFAVSGMLVALGTSKLEHGWLSVIGLMFLNIGLQLTFLGMIGLYIGKIFLEVKGRPLYFIERTFGDENGSKT